MKKKIKTMKNIQNWDTFNESLKEEILNENVITDILKLPFKLLGFILKPIANQIWRLLIKRISIERKWKMTKVMLDTITKIILEKETLIKNLNDTNLSENEREEIQYKLDKMNEDNPNGYDYDKIKQDIIDTIEKTLNKKNEKEREELNWLIEQIESYEPNPDIEVVDILKAFNAEKIIGPIY